MSTEQTRRPLIFSATADAMVPMTDGQLLVEGWVRLRNGNYRKSV